MRCVCCSEGDVGGVDCSIEAATCMGPRWQVAFIRHMRRWNAGMSA